MVMLVVMFASGGREVMLFFLFVLCLGSWDELKMHWVLIGSRPH